MEPRLYTSASGPHDGARPAREGTQAIARGAKLLKLLTGSGRRGARLIDLARDMDLPHPTVRRMLKFFSENRAVEQDPTTRRYRLGSLNFELGLAYVREPDYGHAKFHAFADLISRETGASTYLALAGGTDAICMDFVPKDYAGDGSIRAGLRQTMGYGPGSIALLARYPQEEVDAILERTRAERRMAAHLETGTILGKVASARTHGFSLATTRDDAMALGIVLPGQSSHPRYSVGLLSMDARVKPEQLVDRVLAVAPHALADIMSLPFGR